MNERDIHPIVKELCEVINKEELSKKEIINTLSTFIFSLGASLSGNSCLQTSEQVLIKYAEEPTLGNALMAQALWMRDTWLCQEERQEHVRFRTEDERTEAADSIQDL